MCAAIKWWRRGWWESGLFFLLSTNPSYFALPNCLRPFPALWRQLGTSLMNTAKSTSQRVEFSSLIKLFFLVSWKSWAHSHESDAGLEKNSRLKITIQMYPPFSCLGWAFSTSEFSLLFCRSTKIVSMALVFLLKQNHNINTVTLVTFTFLTN